MCVCVCVSIKNCGFLHTRQFLGQVDVAVLFREVHPFTGRAQQTPAGEDGYCSVGVPLAGGRMQLDENQIAHHHCLGLRLVAESVENDGVTEGKKRAIGERKKDIQVKYDEQYFLSKNLLRKMSKKFFLVKVDPV